jgi:hypothetical protein
MALVVQEPLEIILKFFVSESFIPNKIIFPSTPSFPFPGAVIKTFLAPAVK